MSPKRLTVRQLALQTRLDLDEVLLTLWDVGLTTVNDPDDAIPHDDEKRALRALDVPRRGDFKQISYWASQARLADKEFRDLLEAAEIVIPAGAKTIPKGSVRKVKRIVQQTTMTRVPMIEANAESAARAVTLPPLVWECIGTSRPMRYLTEEEAEQIHYVLVKDFAAQDDPISPPGVADRTLLGSALFRCHTAAGESQKYPTVQMAGAALLHSLILNHAFHNGNKRTALVSTLVFLDRNGRVLTASEDEIFRFVVQIAQHRLVPRGADAQSDREALEIAKWLNHNSRLIRKGERPLKFHVLSRALTSFGCEFAKPRGVGNRMNISRTVPTGRFLRRGRLLTTQVFYGDDGREVDRNTINMVRKALELDEEHGIDSSVFYDDEPPIDDFVWKYQKTLMRLARV